MEEPPSCSSAEARNHVHKAKMDSAGGGCVCVYVCTLYKNNEKVLSSRAQGMGGTRKRIGKGESDVILLQLRTVKKEMELRGIHPEFVSLSSP